MIKLLDAPHHHPLQIKMIDTHTDDAVARRLLELGFIAGSVIEIRHGGPILNDPLAVLVRGMVVALRRHEAALVMVEAKPEVKS
jgi:ferrous iron transport protein A